MTSDAVRSELQELVEVHMSRFFPREAGLIGLVVGLSAIGQALGEIQTGGRWSAILDQLRAGLRDTRAALQFTHDDAGLERLRAFAQSQVALAELLETEIVQLQDAETQS